MLTEKKLSDDAENNTAVASAGSDNFCCMQYMYTINANYYT